MSDTKVRLRGRGKVRDIYDVGDDLVLLVATDRISAFDVVLPIVATSPSRSAASRPWPAARCSAPARR